MWTGRMQASKQANPPRAPTYRPKKEHASEVWDFSAATKPEHVGDANPKLSKIYLPTADQALVVTQRDARMQTEQGGNLDRSKD